jgi:hypothetical protein
MMITLFYPALAMAAVVSGSGGDGVTALVPPLSYPSGNNLELNVFFGITVTGKGAIYDEPTTVFFFYYSVGVVTDQDGTVQFYVTTIDQTFVSGTPTHMGGYVSGPAERENPSSAYGGGISVNRGLIFGDNFTTDKLMGRGYSAFLSPATPISGGFFVPYDSTLNYTGHEYGDTWFWCVATNTTGIGINTIAQEDPL